MADGIYTAKDVGGFGRLADVAFRKREEGRAERRLGMQEQERQLRMAGLRQNLQQIESDQNFKAGLQQYSQDPSNRNKNPFVIQYEYAMAKGRPDMAQQLSSKQLERISSLHDENPEMAAQLANTTLHTVGAIPEPWVYNAGAGKTTMGTTEILDDGTTIIATNQGPQVYSPDGQQLFGEAATGAIQKAREYEVELAGKKTGTREGAKGLAKKALESVEKLDSIKGNIQNINEAIRLIDEGAETGVIANRLPSVRAASIALDNLQGQLGLDVIGNTTFGALSESELKFALDTALPKGLEGPALKNWLNRKKTSQEKLSDYLENAARFLGTPGQTVADWVDYRGSITSSVETPQPEQGAPQDTPAAPQEALDMLTADPSPEMKRYFKETFGYLPKGM